MIAPGGTIGILGGGQLGRMLAMAARSMGYRVRALDPDPLACARGVVDELITASFDDAQGALRLATGCDVVTLEIERIGADALAAVQSVCPVRPGSGVLAMVQDRAVQKAWLEGCGVPVGPWRAASDAAGVVAACAAFGGDAFVKARRDGYDGRGQVRVESAAEASAAFGLVGPCVVEQALPIDAQVSVMVARRPSGEIAVFPLAQNHHEERILAWSVTPAPVSEPIRARAEEIGRVLAERSALEGILAVELFVIGDDLLVNELAPRPHNSFHATERACVTSQFEQQIRAICDLPLGSTELLCPAAIANVLGDAWIGPDGAPRDPDWASALAIAGVRAHVYGKAPRAGRKMGHLSAVGATSGDALARARQALAAL